MSVQYPLPLGELAPDGSWWPGPFDLEQCIARCLTLGGHPQRWSPPTQTARNDDD
jgi:hypothetical protein